MQPESFQELDRQKASLSEQVLCLGGQARLPESLRQLLKQPAPVSDPLLCRTLADLFQRQPDGRKEFLRMEIDILRRAARTQETERIFRAYGVLHLVTPVKHQGRTLHALHSGPLKVTPWTPQEKETLASLCGLRLRDLPDTLDQATIFGPEQLEMIADQQQREARLWQTLLEKPNSAPTESPSPSADTAVGLELLQPGFADHLDLLFSTIQNELRHPEDLNPKRLRRLQAASVRGRHLTGQIRQLSQRVFSGTADVPVHRILENWAQYFRQQHPGLHLHLRLEAEADGVTTNPRHLQHMLFTLMASVADGLPEGRAVMGVSTRNEQRQGVPVLHVEIRDGGGLATFAGVGGELDQRLLLEQNEAADEYADWFSLASHMDAELQLLRDEGVVTRAELFLPLQPADSAVAAPDRHQLWIIEDDDREFESLTHMLKPAGLQISRFRSAADLRTNFALARNSPDLLLLKYHLPDQRGAELRSWLYEQDSRLPVILISSLQATHPGIATANSLPSTLYLQKPFDAKTLLDMVNMNLEDTLPGS